MMRSATWRSRLELRSLAVLAVVPLALAAGGDDDQEDVTATLQAPEDGATFAGGLDVEMVADGVTIEAAGDAREGFGHFHVIVDDGCVDSGTPVPKDANHIHFGFGATTGTIYLTPGDHDLCLQVADGVHSALDITDTATVTVGVRTQDEWCAIVTDVDETFAQADTDGEAFAVRQVTYGNIVNLIAQMTDGLDIVDADVRDVVGAAIDTASQIAAAFVDATDEQAAGEALKRSSVPKVPTR